MLKKSGLLTVCGGDCGHCPNYLGEKQPRCEGCVALKGKPFWVTSVCPIYLCASNHDVKHCGVCKEFPCERFINHYDPTNPEGPRNAITRVGALTYRAKHGDHKTSALLNKLEATHRT